MANHSNNMFYKLKKKSKHWVKGVFMLLKLGVKLVG